MNISTGFLIRQLLSALRRGPAAMWPLVMAGLALCSAGRAHASTPPIVSIISPIDGAVSINTNDLIITVTAEDPDGSIEKVALFRDGHFLAQAFTSPYIFDLVNLAAGTNIYTAVATDNSGDTNVSVAVQIFELAPLPPYFPPTVTLASTVTNVVLTAPTSFSMTASATVYRDGLDRIDFQAVYQPLGATPFTAGEGRSNPSTFTYRNLAVGQYVLTAVVHDIYGRDVTSTPVTVTVLPPAGDVPSFGFTDLGVLGGGESSAIGINTLGVVAGTSTVEPHSEEQRAFTWQAGVFRDFPLNNALTFGAGINDFGFLLGSYAQGGHAAGAFLWTPTNGLVTLPNLGDQAQAFGLNNQGKAVGWSGGPSTPQPVVWDYRGVTATVAPLSPGFGQAWAISEADVAVGYLSTTQFGPAHAVRWASGIPQDLGVLTTLGGLASVAYGISGSGQIVGSVFLEGAQAHGFFWDEGAIHELMPLVASSGWPTAINSQGWMVGQSTAGAGFSAVQHATFWRGGVPFDLNTLVTNLGDAILLRADAINNQGKVVGTCYVNGQQHGYLLTPSSLATHVPPSATLANPLASATVAVGDTVALLASAQAGESPLVRVDYYVGNSLVASASESPYLAYWHPQSAGTACVKAVAVDSAGELGASAPVCLTVQASPPRYQLANIGELATKAVAAGGLNSAGHFVGQARTELGFVGFIYNGGIITYLQNPGPQASFANAINDSDQVAVLADPLAGIYENGAIRNLKAFPAATAMSFGAAINNAGMVAGRSGTDSHETHAALFVGDTVTDLGSTLGQYSQANAINNLGVVVGWSQSAPGQPAKAFTYDAVHGVSQFGSTLGGTDAQATGINDAGVIVGNASDGQGHQVAFIYQSGLMQSLGAPGGVNSFAKDINSSGQVVGYFGDGATRAFLAAGGPPVDLNDLLVPGSPAILTQAIAINDRGQILAVGHNSAADSDNRVFLLNPTVTSGDTNQPPSVSVQAPVAGAIYDQGDSIPLLASASDQDGNVTLVAFFAGSTPIGSAAVAPFGITWPNVPAGTYPITAVAFDDLGASRTSAPVTVTVRALNPDAPAVAIIGAAPELENLDVRHQLRHTLLFSRVDILPFSPLPTPNQLEAYQSILVYSRGNLTFPSGLGDLLGDYIGTGHGIVLALDAADSSANRLSGYLSRYLPWTSAANNSHGHEVMLKDLPDHPILAGVNSFDNPSAGYADTVTLTPGSIQIASWDTHAPLVVARQLTGRIVGLNMNPVSQAVSGTGWSTNSDGGRLLGNSLLWAGTRTLPFLLAQAVPDGDQSYYPGQEVELRLSSLELPEGGTIQIYRDNDLLASLPNSLPTVYTWTNAPVGSHLLTAVYTNSAGLSITAESVPIKVDSRISIDLITPADSSVVYLPTNILMQVTVSDLDAAITKVDYFLDGKQRIGTSTTPPYDFNFTQFTIGTLNVSAVVTDALGATRSTPIHHVTVINNALSHLTQWIGTDGSWFVPTNWTAGPPRAQDSALINQGTARIATSAAVATNLTVGKSATGALVQSGGSMVVGGDFSLGEAVGSAGSYRLEEPGTLLAGQFVVGLQGKGSVVQNGGKFYADRLLLAANLGATAAYDLNDGVLVTPIEGIGGGTSARFTQLAGTHQVTDTLQLGHNQSVGVFQLGGGSLSARFEVIGNSGSPTAPRSTLYQSGGLHQVVEALHLGEDGNVGGLTVSGGLFQARQVTLGDGSFLELVADPATNRFQVTNHVQLGGVLTLKLPSGYVPLGGDAITLMTYGSFSGKFAQTNFPPAANGAVWKLEYQNTGLVLRAVPPPQVVIVSPFAADPQADLFHQTVTLSNQGDQPLQGSRIYFPGLPPGWELYNAAGEENGTPYIEVDSVIPPHSSVQFEVQFLIPGQGRPAQQNYVVQLGNVAGAGAAEKPLQVEAADVQADGSVRLQLVTGRNRSYLIEYSDDLVRWTAVPQPLAATGARTQWVDDGAPKTATPPATQSHRFYRIVEAP